MIGRRPAVKPATEYDTRVRQMDKAEAGYWIMRCIKQGPLCPAAIIWHETWYEPSCPENRMDGTRSPHLGAYISGRSVAISEVWLRRGKLITEAEYNALLAEISSNISNNRYDPRTSPYRAVETDRM